MNDRDWELSFYMAQPTTCQEENWPVRAGLMGKDVTTVWQGDVMLGHGFLSLSECYPSHRAMCN